MRTMIPVFVAIAVCVIFAIGAIWLPSFTNHVIHQQVIQKKVLGQSSESQRELLKKFINPPYTTQLNVWIYDVRNAENLMNGHTTLAIIDERGPYNFKTVTHKKVRISEDGNRLFYRTFRNYTFDHHDSCQDCYLDDVVIVASPAFQALIENVYDKVFAKPFVDIIMNWSWDLLHTAYRRLRVRNLLFEGYVDEEIKHFCDMPLSDCPELPDRIGVFYNSNNTNEDGEFEVGTGKDNINNAGHVYSWNGHVGRMNESYWFGHAARAIKGTDSQIYPPFKLFERKKLQLFIGISCRTVEMQFYGYSVVDGLPMQRYIPIEPLQADELAKGFCGQTQSQNFYSSQIDTCPPKGLMELDGCNPQAIRVYASNGHFYGADEELRRNMQGFPEPNPTDDVSYVDIEPHLGLVVQAESRSLLSVGVKGKDFGPLSSMTERIMPLLFMNSTVIFDENSRNLLAFFLTAVYFTTILPLICFALCLTFLAVAAMLLFRRYYRLQIIRVEAEKVHLVSYPQQPPLPAPKPPLPAPKPPLPAPKPPLPAPKPPLPAPKPPILSPKSPLPHPISSVVVETPEGSKISSTTTKSRTSTSPTSSRTQ